MISTHRRPVAFATALAAALSVVVSSTLGISTPAAAA